MFIIVSLSTHCLKKKKILSLAGCLPAACCRLLPSHPPSTRRTIPLRRPTTGAADHDLQRRLSLDFPPSLASPGSTRDYGSPPPPLPCSLAFTSPRRLAVPHPSRCLRPKLTKVLRRCFLRRRERVGRRISISLSASGWRQHNLLLDPSLAPPWFRLHAITRLPDSSARSAAGLKWRAQALPSIQDVDRASALHPRQPCLPHAGAWRSEQEDPSFMVYVFFTAISAIDRNRCMVYFSCVSS